MEEILEQILRLDNAVLIFIQEYIRYDAANPFFERIYQIGSSGLFWPVLSVILLIPKRTRRTGVLSLLSLLCAWVIAGYLMPEYVERPRPYETLSYVTYLVDDVGTYSFPSLCACMSFASSVLIYKNGPRMLGIVSVLIAAVFSFAELYVGVCYPTDTLIGAVIGILLGLIMYWLLGERWSRKKRRRR